MHRFRCFKSFVWQINGVMHTAAPWVVKGSWDIVRQGALFPAKYFGGIVAAFHGYALLNGANQRTQITTHTVFFFNIRYSVAVVQSWHLQLLLKRRTKRVSRPKLYLCSFPWQILLQWEDKTLNAWTKVVRNFTLARPVHLQRRAWPVADGVVYRWCKDRVKLFK